MKTKNNSLSYCKLVGEQYIFYYDSNGNVLEDKIVVRPASYHEDSSIQSYFLIGDFAFEGLYLDDNGVLCYVLPFCKHCGKTNVIRKGFNNRQVLNYDGSEVDLKLKRYYCKDCGIQSQTELTGVYDPYCKIPNHTKRKVRLSLRNGHKTLREQSDDVELYTGMSISHETVHKAMLITNTLYFLNENLELSGYYSYDAQWIPVDDTMWYRLVLIDIKNYQPVAEMIAPHENNDTIMEFINKALPNNKRNGIITDSKNGYDYVMRKLGFKHHQHCTFHLLQRINEEINDEVKEYKKEYKIKLKDEKPNYTEKKLNKETKKAGEQYRKQFNIYVDEIKNIFKQKNYKDALKCIDELTKNIRNYPKFLKEYLDKYFFPEYKKYIVFLLDEVKEHMESTNNKCENYIGKIIDKAHKGKFKTIKGFFNYNLPRIEGWIEDHVDYAKKKESATE